MAHKFGFVRVSNIIRVSESSPNSEWLIMSNQGTACFLELLLYATDDPEKTEHQKELISFLEDRKCINKIASGTADFDITDMPWDENCLTVARALAKSLQSIQSDNLHFVKEHNKCLGLKLRGILYTAKIMSI